ncbi:hypothetical protein ACOMHN_010747 [Nucella lapillus]
MWECCGLMCNSVIPESGVDFDVVQAMDVNTSANAIYQHNFPHVNICASSIGKLTLDQLRRWSPNTVLMSPPCQPFTRVGKKQDCQDPRTQSFLHLLDLLRKLDHKPEYILVENVKGFEVSETRSMLLDMLQDCKYTYQEFLLTPLQFGIPNCRMRYYLVAKLKPLELAFWTSDKLLDMVPVEALQWLRYRQSQDGVVSDSPPVTAQSPSSLLSHCQQCYAQQSAATPQFPPPSSSPHCSPLGDRAESGHTCHHHHHHHHQTPEDTSHHSCQSDVPDKTGNDERLCGANPELCCCVNCSDSRTTTEGQQDSKAAPCAVRKCRKVVRTPCGEGSMPKSPTWEDFVMERDISALTLAEAGRNMRHCEEEDVLVCGDGTRLRDYLETGDAQHFQSLLVPDRELRMFVVMDVVHPSFRKSSCFTKRYGHYIEGAGSLVMMTDDVQVVKDASEFKSRAVEQKNRREWQEPELSILRRLKVRYFTPREVANLLCFPSEFEFPEGFSTIQCHRVLGNSLNVHVVSVLIRLLLMEPGVI